MLIRPISKAVAISVVAIAGTGAAHAQSSVQCTLGPNGQLEAALVWRNTLGAERADALCRTASAPVAQQQTQRPAIVASVQQPPVQYQYPVQPTIAAVGAIPTYQATAPQHRYPAPPTAYQAVQHQHAGIQQVMNNPTIAPQQHYPVRPPTAVAAVQHQSPAMFAGGAALPFNPADYEAMPVHSMASLQSSSAEFVPMFQR